MEDLDFRKRMESRAIKTEDNGGGSPVRHFDENDNVVFVSNDSRKVYNWNEFNDKNELIRSEVSYYNAPTNTHKTLHYKFEYDELSRMVKTTGDINRVTEYNEAGDKVRYSQPVKNKGDFNTLIERDSVESTSEFDLVMGEWADYTHHPTNE